MFIYIWLVEGFGSRGPHDPFSSGYLSGISRGQLCGWHFRLRLFCCYSPDLVRPGIAVVEHFCVVLCKELVFPCITFASAEVPASYKNPGLALDFVHEVILRFLRGPDHLCAAPLCRLCCI